MNKIFKVGLIGCGHIAETYFRGQQYFNNFKIIACADIDQKAADKCAKLFNIKSKTVSEILKDNEIEVILNLTIPQSHYSVSKKVLNSGKHVYSEKPLATYFAKGKELVSLAKKNKLYLDKVYFFLLVRQVLYLLQNKLLMVFLNKHVYLSSKLFLILNNEIVELLNLK